MSIVFWFSTFFVLFAVLYYFAGMHAGKQTHTENDYFLAGRNLGFWSLTGTLLATHIGAGLIVGGADHAYAYGFPGLFYGMGLALGFVVLGFGVAAALRSLEVGTTAEIFEKYFHSSFLKKCASFFSILSLTGIFICQVIASRKLLVGLGVESDLLFLGFWAVLVAYTMYGGLPAVVATDLLQIILILSVFLVLSLYFVWSGVLTAGTVSALCSVTTMPEGGFSYWFSYLGIPVLFSFAEQDLAQRFFAARSSAIATAASWASALGLLIFATIPALIGVQARLSGLVVAKGQSSLLVLVAAHVGPIGQALVMCALIAAIASTADSLLCAVSSNIVQDFVPQSRGGAFRMRAAEVATLFVGVSGIIGSYCATNILGVMTQSYELLVSGVLVPVLVCIVGGRLSRIAAFCAVFVGFGAYSSIWCGLWAVPFPGSLVALGASCAAYLLGLIISYVVNE